VIRTDASGVADWLDACCWSCGTEEVTERADGRVLCVPCREELLAEPSADAVHVARHAYWESHALRCCWRCMHGAVDPDDEIGLCLSCREDVGGRYKRGRLGI
jgi:hypothetical protein